MNLRKIFKPVATALLTVGLVAFGVAPANATPDHDHKSVTTYRCDTGWG